VLRRREGKGKGKLSGFDTLAVGRIKCIVSLILDSDGSFD
jgi:hypothetical protein